MRITEIRFDLKKGLPNFSSIAVGLTATVDEKENLEKAFDKLKQEAETNLSEDPSFIHRSEVT